MRSQDPVKVRVIFDMIERKVKINYKQNLGVKHEIPGPSESLLALAASKAHSLSTGRWRLTTW